MKAISILHDKFDKQGFISLLCKENWKSLKLFLWKREYFIVSKLFQLIEFFMQKKSQVWKSFPGRMRDEPL